MLCGLRKPGTFFLYLVSQHPAVEARILEELDALELSITPERPQPRRLTFADLGKLTYLQATVKVFTPAAVLDPQSMQHESVHRGTDVRQLSVNGQ